MTNLSDILRLPFGRRPDGTPQSDRTTFVYDDAGRRTVERLANGTRSSFSYDAASQVTQIVHRKSDGTAFSQFDYAYNAVGSRTRMTELSGDRVTWAYDNSQQLLAERRSGANAYAHTFVYDAGGNRTLKEEDGARTTTTYDAANQIVHAQDASGRTTYPFDANGNQAVVLEPSGDRTTTSWDYENRPTVVRLPSGDRVTTTYNADFRRVREEQ